MLAGAGDRLGLKCEVTGESVPTAMLPYCGRTLLSGLLRDLQVLPPTCSEVFCLWWHRASVLGHWPSLTTSLPHMHHLHVCDVSHCRPMSKLSLLALLWKSLQLAAASVV